MQPTQGLLITGGTGSFGKMMLRHLINLPREQAPGRIIILSRDEDKQHSQRQEFDDERIEYVIGDVRDPEVCMDVMKDVDIVIHAAALKHIPTGEYFPSEVISTNLNGTANLVRAIEMTGVSKFIFLSTDKAVYPINAYGMSKALGEKILMAAAGKNLAKGNGAIYCVVRYGNVMGSRGSVIPLFIKQIKEKGEVTITDYNMTRFLLKLKQAIDLVNHAIEFGKQGRLYVKKSPACTVDVLVQALELHYGREIKRRIVGIRPGEKIHETLLTADENMRSEEEKDMFDETPIAVVRSYFECKMLYDKVIMSRYQEPFNFLNGDFTSKDTKLLDAHETLSLLKEAELI